MDEAGQRAALDALIRARGSDYAALSRLLGRNPAYIQQYIKRGVPRRLDGDDRRALAAYFGLAEDALGAASPPPGEAIVAVPRLDLDAAAGAGALAAAERVDGRIGFPGGWLRARAAGRVDRLSIIRVTGDSMIPTLVDGDDILVDGDDGAARLRDGIYVLRIDEALVVKRLAVDPVRRGFAICSDNPAYPRWGDVAPADVAIIGRVIWFGRSLG